ncbi:MAG: glutathione S-transferase family protein [Cyanobacteria bacterium P01_F01_bin.3]
MEKLTLYGRAGWGSVLIESQLVWYDIPFTFYEVNNLFSDESARQSLEKLNPLAQVPTLIMSDGSVMTESSAITLWLAEKVESEALVPAARMPERAQFLRWLIFITSNLYPTYTYSDRASWFVPEKLAQSDFVHQVNQYTEKLYLILNAAAADPWFLGERFSALDIYICAMSHWPPGQAWLEENAPTLFNIAVATKALPKLSEVWARNYPDGWTL